MYHLQTLHEELLDKGLIILDFNSSDNKDIALEFLKDNNATFPMIIDNSDAAIKTARHNYRSSGVPLNYILDREGKVVGAWYGYEKGHSRAKAAVEKAGLSIK